MWMRNSGICFLINYFKNSVSDLAFPLEYNIYRVGAAIETYHLISYYINNYLQYSVNAPYIRGMKRHGAKK